MTALRGRMFPPPLALRLFAELAELLLWLVDDVVLVLGRLPGLLLPAGRLALGEEVLGLPLEGAAVPEGRLPLGLPLPAGFAEEVGLSPEGDVATGLFSATTGSFTAGFS